VPSFLGLCEGLDAFFGFDLIRVDVNHDIHIVCGYKDPFVMLPEAVANV
jgi:hypothetical protein